MSPERRQRIEELFEQIVDEVPDEQHRFLKAACGNDDDLLGEVMALLKADIEGSRILEHDLASLAKAFLDTTPGVVTPWRFGRYVIHECLGEGGMGAVYLAERSDLGDRVAVKFLRDPWNSAARQERFAAEQRILAGLSHRYIARLYDNGVTEGTPWFAMEYVRGVSITDHCHRNGLALRPRLELFRAACEAVSYAHRNLTVHLDLKPSNILVNNEGELKLVDFGIARHLDPEGRESDRAARQRLFSHNYAAPEQIRGEPPDVQMDVYSLGVVLYQLLLGAVPSDVPGASVAEVFRVPETETLPPSLMARRQRGAPIRASKAEWDDLDVLCLTAVHRDRTRRYGTVDALLLDLNRFLKYEPLEAHPHQVPYRLGKYLRRNRRALSAAAAVLVVVASLTVFFTVRLIATRERALLSETRTQRMYRLMLNLFEGDDNAAGPAQELRVVSLLDRGVLQIDSLKEEPDLQAELRSTLGGLYHRLGHLDRAEPLLLSAWNMRKAGWGPDDPKTMEAQLALIGLRVDQSQIAEAERLARESVEAANRRSARNNSEIARAKGMLGKVLATKGDYKAAVPLLEEAVDVLSKNPGSAELSDALGDLANVHYYLGDANKSEVVNLKGLELDRKLFGADHPNAGIDLFNLGNIQLDRADYPAAEQLFRKALEIDRAWYGDSHPKTASARLMVGRAVDYQGRSEEAAGLYRQALRVTKEIYGEQHPRYASVLSLMGDLDTRRHDLATAEKLFLQSAEIFRKALGERHEFYLHQISNLAAVRLAEKRYVEAEALLRPALQSLQAIVPDQRYTALAEVRLGAALAGQKRYSESQDYALAGYTSLKKLMGRSAVELLSARRELAEIYIAMNLPAKADALKAEGAPPGPIIARVAK
jgi:serine/threonine-protein kinase